MSISGIDALIKKSINREPPSKEPDREARQEIENLDREAARLSHRIKVDEHDQRIDFAEKIYRLSCYWLLAILLLVLSVGTKGFSENIHLSDRVLITILTTTTITVLGLFITVLKYIFGRKN